MDEIRQVSQTLFGMASKKQESWNNWSTDQDNIMIINCCSEIIKFYNCIDYCQCYNSDYIM